MYDYVTHLSHELFNVLLSNKNVILSHDNIIIRTNDNDNVADVIIIIMVINVFIRSL